jgi:hypothetical protein
MTMPGKIWADEDHMYWLEKKDSTDTPYIRADIADELASALSRFLDGDDTVDMIAGNLLDRYRAVKETK